VSLAGCGGGQSRSEACSTPVVAPASRPEAAAALRNAIAADQAALDALDAADSLAARFRGAKARAEQALRSFTGDPLRSRTMSPTANILTNAQRVVGETRALRRQLCS
jgi:hypothetical protein